MQRASQAPVINRTIVDGMLGALLARPADALTNTVHARLYSAGPNPPTPTSVVGDFTECTFAGYAAVALATMTGPVTTDSGDARALLANATFVASSGLVLPGQNAIGYFVTLAGGTAMFFSEAFGEVVAFGQAGDYLDLSVVCPISTPGNAA